MVFMHKKGVISDMMDAYTPEKNIYTVKKTNSITQNTIDELNSKLSKSGKSVLLSLYRTPRIQQKALAVNNNTSPTSLSNLLSKIEAIRPPLLNVEHSGRSKYYSLTKIAEQYVASELIPKESININTFFSFPTSASLLNETLNLLYQFQSLAGSEWLLILDDMLSNGSDTSEAENELFGLYTQFINNMNQMHIQKETLSIHKVYDELDNNILIRRLENYFKNNLQESDALIPLFDLEKQNPQKAIRLINYAFAEIKPQVFGTDDLSLFSDNDLPISSEQYHAIFRRLSMMINEFLNQHETKLQMLKNWEKVFYTSNLSLDFIAEKCNTIYLTESGKHA